MRSLYLYNAGFVIECRLHPTEPLHYQSQFIHNISLFFKPYLISKINGKADACIDIVPDTQIDSIQKKRIQRNYTYLFQRNGYMFKTHYGISLFQFQLIVRAILEDLLHTKEGFFIHASAVKIKNATLLFMGPSGAGKSTVVSLLQPYFPQIADDVGIIKREKNSYVFFQSIFKEKYDKPLHFSSSLPILGIIFLQKDSGAKLFQLTSGIKRRYMRQIWSQSINPRIPSYIDKHIANFSFFLLKFSKNKDLVQSVIKSSF